jgi:hypothetical protein
MTAYAQPIPGAALPRADVPLAALPAVLVVPANGAQALSLGTLYQLGDRSYCLATHEGGR